MKNLNYLTQSKLTALLQKYFTIDIEVKVGDTRLRSDIQFEYNDQKYAVEFDGAQHYENIDFIERDQRKDKILTEQGFKIVRIPYWIQMTDLVFEHFFGFKYPEKLIKTYNHGFIDNAAHTPAFYCNKGMNRFLKEMGNLCNDKTHVVVIDIISSLMNHKKYKGSDLISFERIDDFMASIKAINDRCNSSELVLINSLFYSIKNTK